MSCEEHKVFDPIEILFDFLKNRKYNDYKRVACQRKSSSFDRLRIFLCRKREE